MLTHPANALMPSGQTLASFLEDEGITTEATRDHFRSTINKMGDAAWDACHVQCECNSIAFGDDTHIRLLISVADCDLLNLADGLEAMAACVRQAVKGGA